MKISKIVLSSLLGISLFGATPVLAQNEENTENTGGMNGISEEYKAYLKTDEHKAKIKAKNEWLKTQVKSNRSAGRMNITHRYQVNPTWCGPGAGRMVIEYITGDLISLETLVREMNTDENPGVDGTYVNDVSDVVVSYTGLPYEVEDVNNGNFYNNVKADFDADYPVIYDVKPFVLGDDFYAPKTSHYIVGSGYSTSRQLYYSDPWRKSEYNRTVTEKQMSDALKANGGYYIY